MCHSWAFSAESLRALDSLQLSEISGDALARFLAYISQYRTMLSPELLDDISSAFRMSIHLQVCQFCSLRFVCMVPRSVTGYSGCAGLCPAQHTSMLHHPHVCCRARATRS